MPTTVRPQIDVIHGGTRVGHILSCPVTGAAAVVPNEEVSRDLLLGEARRLGYRTRIVLNHGDRLLSPYERLLRSLGTQADEQASGGLPELTACGPDTLSLDGVLATIKQDAPVWTWMGKSEPSNRICGGLRIALGAFHIRVHSDAEGLFFSAPGVVLSGRSLSVPLPALDEGDGTLVYPSRVAESDVTTLGFLRRRAAATASQQRSQLG